MQIIGEKPTIVSFEEHIDLAAEYLDKNLTNDEIIKGVKRLAGAPEVFGEVHISKTRRHDAITKLIKAKNQ